MVAGLVEHALVLWGLPGADVRQLPANMPTIRHANAGSCVNEGSSRNISGMVLASLYALMQAATRGYQCSGPLDAEDSQARVISIIWTQAFPQILM